MAVLAAMADLEAERYDVACVVGVEMMRNVPTRDAVSNLGAAAWVPYETDGVPMVWPEVFAALGDEYDRRYGLDAEHLGALARNSFDNARRNPNAQTRGWDLPEHAFEADERDNPVVAGRLEVRRDLGGAGDLILGERDAERAVSLLEAGVGHQAGAAPAELHGEPAEVVSTAVEAEHVDDLADLVAICVVELVSGHGLHRSLRRRGRPHHRT